MSIRSLSVPARPCQPLFLLLSCALLLSCSSPAGPTAGNPPPAPARAWHQVASWSGTADKVTKTFHVGADKWKLVWELRPGEYGAAVLGIFLRGPDSFPNLILNTTVAGTDSSFFSAPADYYLQITAVGSYSVSISEFR